MSTRSTIINEHWIEIYSDCSEPQHIFGKWQGDNLYLLLEPFAVKCFTVKGQYIEVKLSSEYKLFGKHESFRIWGGDIVRAEMDVDGLCVVIKGGSRTAVAVEQKQLPNG